MIEHLPIRTYNLCCRFHPPQLFTPGTYLWVQQALRELRKAPLEIVGVRIWYLSTDTVQKIDWEDLMFTLMELRHLRLLRFELWGSETRATMSEIVRRQIPRSEDRVWQVEFVGRS
jgi:hypothetical protein